MPAGLYFVLKYFSFTLSHTSLIATLFHNDTMHSVPSMTLQPISTLFIVISVANIKITVILGIGPSSLLGWY